MNCFRVYTSDFISSCISCPIRFLKLPVLLLHSVEIGTSQHNRWGVGAGGGRSLGTVMGWGGHMCPISPPNPNCYTSALRPSRLPPTRPGFLALSPTLSCHAHLCQLHRCAWSPGSAFTMAPCGAADFQGTLPSSDS